MYYNFNLMFQVHRKKKIVYLEKVNECMEEIHCVVYQEHVIDFD